MVTCAARVGHRRHQRDGGRPASDHDDTLARVVEVLGPVLGVDRPGPESARCPRTGAGSPARSGSSRQPRTASEHLSTTVSPVSLRCASTVHRASSLDHDAPTTRCPSGCPVDAVFARGLADVVEDRGAVGDRLLVHPWLEGEAVGVQVGVRADAGVAEQVPCPAALLAALEDRVGLAGQPVLQVPRGADTGDAGADDHHVQVLGRCALVLADVGCAAHRLPPLSRFGADDGPATLGNTEQKLPVRVRSFCAGGGSIPACRRARAALADQPQLRGGLLLDALGERDRHSVKRRRGSRTSPQPCSGHPLRQAEAGGAPRAPGTSRGSRRIRGSHGPPAVLSPIPPSSRRCMGPLPPALPHLAASTCGAERDHGELRPALASSAASRRTAIPALPRSNTTATFSGVRRRDPHRPGPR